MKSSKFIPFIVAAALAGCLFVGCDSSSDISGGTDSSSSDMSFTNPGDYLGGGGEVTETPSSTDSSTVEEAADSVSDLPEVDESIPDDATQITGKTTISEAGNYYVTGEVEGKITIECEDVTLYLSNAQLTNEKKVIESDYGLTIVLIGTNTVTNVNDSGNESNAIDCAGDLTIMGDGSLSVSSTKNAVKGNSIIISGATVTIDSQKDGLHAEVDAYDDAEEEPTPSYDDGGYVYIDNANVTIVSADDGIQADTFVYITGEDTVINITAGGGAPDTVTEASSDAASGKGIKAGQIDWGDAEEDLEWDGYLVAIDGGVITVNSNDDALHSNGELIIEGGTITLSSGDDAIHSDDLLQISGGDIVIDCCYEGIESAKVEISGGNIEVTAYEDGINAADGTQNAVGVSNSNCHIIITGGYISVNCIGTEGDGIDSNGTILISGGQLYIAGSSNSSDSALDADGGIVINGGYVFAVGALGMVETPASNSAQCSVSFARSSSISAGTTLYLCDSDGNIIMYFVTPRSCQSVILSCPELEVGKSYSIYGGDSLLSTFTVTSTITSVGSTSSITNPGGTPGGMSPGFNTPGFNGGRR